MRQTPSYSARQAFTLSDGRRVGLIVFAGQTAQGRLVHGGVAVEHKIPVSVVFKPSDAARSWGLTLNTRFQPLRSVNISKPMHEIKHIRRPGLSPEFTVS
jgi:hypothetical protein